MAEFDYEKLGSFYLGRPWNLEEKRAESKSLLYSSKDLTTHAVCVGMTGSGKTGLCLTLLEEAAIDQIPAIVIDPKGDLGNLLLTFPDLEPEDFAPWVDPAEATRKGMTVEELAKKNAQDWRKGLADWDQTPDRIAKFRDSADIAIYTPGSNAGLPLTVVRSFAIPDDAILEDSDALRERITGAVSGLLALLGVQGDPLRSREHILLSTILERAWKSGRSLDLPQLIREIQKPPFTTIGVMDLESIFPAADRFGLSMSLNNLLASPGFSAWLEGEPLDVASLLHTDSGKPRISILSIAHLNDAERMFFVTILLNEVISWMRSQAGTSSLRAILYMDEVFGYFPPTANPPSKTPMLTLLKQARAFGLGVVLATQNPVDLDYKGLSNAGTWFIGRLQTDRDKQRVLDGLEGASAAAGAAFDRSSLEKTISGLGNRVFLMNNVHDDHPVVFQSRYVLSYLRGPLTTKQIAMLMAARKVAAVVGSKGAGSLASRHSLGSSAGARPVLPPEIGEVFITERGVSREGKLVYEPLLMARARVHITNARMGVDEWDELTLVKPISAEEPVTWEKAELYHQGDEPDVEKTPASAEAGFAPLPSDVMRAKQFAGLVNDAKEYLFRTYSITLYQAAAVKLTSQPGETEGQFRTRLTQSFHEQRDLQVEKLRAKLAPKFKMLRDREERARQKLERQETAAKNQKLNSVLSAGATIFGAVFGRKLGSATNIGKAATTARNWSKLGTQQQAVEQSKESLESIQAEMAQLDLMIAEEMAKIDERTSAEHVELEKIEVKPKKTDVSVKKVEIAWMPTRSR
ncbi:MAG TPA: ATP-binding protein [Planctomycetaceae bacterium]|nr:ATP-binding protein [Planctomycetaceae bacterium]